MGAYISRKLLPTVSSLVFLTPASVATKRGFHMEAMIYHACDGPAISIWITLIGECKHSTLTMFGVLTCAVGIYQDRWAYGIYSGPVGSAVFIITVRRSVYIQLVGPGCCFGVLADEWEYSYVHSFYHLSMAVSFVLLLPKINRYAGTGDPAKLTKCLCV
uniref:Myomaker, myoblast fusion factor n=1 Tax=Hucho hucho TaxID=62062 RepID=A0A4W5QPU1_9TELE